MMQYNSLRPLVEETCLPSLTFSQWLERGTLETLADHNLYMLCCQTIEVLIRQAISSTACGSLGGLVTRHPAARLHIVAGSDELRMLWYSQRGLRWFWTGP